MEKCISQGDRDERMKKLIRCDYCNGKAIYDSDSLEVSICNKTKCLREHVISEFDKISESDHKEFGEIE